MINFKYIRILKRKTDMNKIISESNIEEEKRGGYIPKRKVQIIPIIMLIFNKVIILIIQYPTHK